MGDPFFTKLEYLTGVEKDILFVAGVLGEVARSFDDEMVIFGFDERDFGVVPGIADLHPVRETYGQLVEVIHHGRDAEFGGIADEDKDGFDEGVDQET